MEDSGDTNKRNLKLRVVSGGVFHNTHVYDAETGEEFRNLLGLSFDVQAGERASVFVELAGEDVELEVESPGTAHPASRND